MSWSRGLLWLWIGVTVLWVAGNGVLLFVEWPDEALWKAAHYRIQYGQAVRIHLVRTAREPLIPPAVLFILGWGCLWIGRGFNGAYKQMRNGKL